MFMDNYDGQQHDDSLEKDPPASREEQDLTNRTQHLSEDRQTPDPAARHRVSSHLPVPVSRDQPARGTARRTRRAHLSRLNRRLIHERVHRRTRRRRQFARRVVTSMAVIFATILVVLSGSIGAAYAYYQSQLPMLNGIANHTMFQTTRIYDRNGNLLYEINDPNYGRRTYVNYNDISPLLINATIAAEDHTFWTNNGVDFQGIVRAAITDVQSQQTVEGASTITQQLIKWQFFLNDSRSLQVKAEEAILAYGITQQLPKWKIMEMYLNVIYYGELNYGAEAAAEDYFGLQPTCSQDHCIPAVGQLDRAQDSMLAGLPQSPSYYDAILNKPAAMQRQKTVLDAMVQLHMITAQQEQQAIQETQKFNFKSYVNPDAIQAPHFVQYVIDDVLVPLLGAQNLYTGGYNIYTTLDLNLEKKVEQIAYYRLYQDPCPQYLGCLGPLYKSHNVNDAAVVVMDPFNGEILAMDGSASYNNTSKKVDGQFNAALALRQPGSSIKPVVYATAFEMGLYPAMVFPNHLTIYPTPDSGSPYGYYAPQDYGGVFLNDFPQTIRNDLANSLNVPAVDAIEYTGIPNVLNMAARLGLTSISSLPPSKLGPSMALGSEAVSLLSLTDAYATFANQGVRVAPTSILEITNNQGQVLYSYDASHPHGVRAVSPEVAFLISSMLSDKAARYHEFAPGNPLELDRPAAAKTGTSDTFIDNWTMGYTPHITVGVWVGNADNSPMDNNVIGITGAGPIWHDVMEYVSNYYHFPADDFIRPADVQEGTVSANTGLLAQPGEPTVTDWFIDGTIPTVHDQYTPPSHRRHCFIFCPPGGGNQGG